MEIEPTKEERAGGQVDPIRSLLEARKERPRFERRDDAEVLDRHERFLAVRPQPGGSDHVQAVLDQVAGRVDSQLHMRVRQSPGRVGRRDHVDRDVGELQIEAVQRRDRGADLRFLSQRDGAVVDPNALEGRRRCREAFPIRRVLAVRLGLSLRGRGRLGDEREVKLRRRPVDLDR